MHQSDQSPHVRLLVTDLDNTLYDWLASWYPAFSAMLEMICTASCVPRDRLLMEIRDVNQRRGTSEYSYLLNELPSLIELHPGEDIAEVYDDAIHEYRSIRKKTLRLYPGVKNSLLRLRKLNVPIVAYTESLAYYSSRRLRELELDGIIDRLYSPKDNDFPAGVTPQKLRTQPPEFYDFKTAHLPTPAGALKPDAEVLKSIIDDMGFAASETVYVGDSLLKDVAMAQNAGALDVLAGYGAVQDRAGYDLLRRVTYWTEGDVRREREIGERCPVTPTYVLHDRFDEIFQLFRFGRLAMNSGEIDKTDSTSSSGKDSPEPGAASMIWNREDGSGNGATDVPLERFRSPAIRAER